ncbi:PREDICTED: glucan endo-1,3-beta-glucosidase 3 [Nelumbo nucifera]|uniref:Glucan endo-1,3-beta-glucosidase 3 n=1 Tax=Nelumbo nucifera TaxID=4432 RepID=A0A1U8BJS8_NELNU|nr:PREDICTED: glucan endo-1,3-beta-glucosidase 3 [Nelumbo nucifera]
MERQVEVPVIGGEVVNHSLDLELEKDALMQNLEPRAGGAYTHFPVSIPSFLSTRVPTSTIHPSKVAIEKCFPFSQSCRWRFVFGGFLSISFFLFHSSFFPPPPIPPPFLFFVPSSKLLKMGWFLHLLLFCLLGLTDAGQESVNPLNIYDPTPAVLQTLAHAGLPVSISVSEGDLRQVSSSVLIAESWVRAHVLAHFPSTKITNIVVGNTVLCSKDHEEMWGLVLPSVKNVYHSLVRWGLEKEIKVSAAFSTDCLHPRSTKFRDDLIQRLIKPLLDFLQNSSSTYTINPPPGFSLSLSNDANLVSAHMESMKKLGVFHLNNINVIVPAPEEKKLMSRKLSVIHSSAVGPFPARPTPLPEIPPSSIHSSVGFSVPAHTSKSSLPPPPLAGWASSPPSMSFSFAPEGPPVVIPSNPPDLAPLPPCNAIDIGAPTPETGEKGLWCVAKPSVPTETLQEAMDYACGEGGADCDEIMPNGNCYYPDTAVAHASYAFNSYWQKNKNNGGSCSFGGTAMIISSDPSFLHCRFILS